MRIPNLFQDTSPGRSQNANAMRLRNIYPVTDGNKKSEIVFFGTPGLKPWVDLGTGKEVRGAIVMGGTLYAVSGTGFYSVTAAGAHTLLGPIERHSSGPVSMEENGTQVIVTTGLAGYLWDGATFAKITAEGFPGGGICTYQDGYFIVLKPDSQQFGISGLYDGKTWDALDFASAEGQPDKALSIISDHRELWILGEETAEVWYDSGAQAFPFDRVQGGFQEKGTAAKGSLAKIDNSVFWLGRNKHGQGQVIRATGYSAYQIISTRAIDQEIAKYADISDAQAFTYSQEGQSFYALTFPSADATFVYDCASALWHERGPGEIGRWQANCHALFNGKHIVGDCANGKLYTLDLDYFMDDDQPLTRMADSKILYSNLAYILHQRLQIDMETGVGIVTGQGQDPQIALRVSDDAGHTWGTEKWKSMGRMGEYRARVIWTPLGRARDRAYRIKMTDPVKFVMLASFVETAEGVR